MCYQLGRTSTPITATPTRWHLRALFIAVGVPSWHLIGQLDFRQPMLLTASRGSARGGMVGCESKALMQSSANRHCRRISPPAAGIRPDLAVRYWRAGITV